MLANSFTLFDVLALRREFPILQQQVNGKPLAFLDSAASSQKPRRVIACLEEYYERYNANVHRGVYKLSEEATFAYERARGKVARFIGAHSPKEIVFTRNTTEAINLVARAWGDANVRAGDRILLTVMEHHSNMLGTINPVREIAARAHDAGALVLVDGAQSVPHMPVNVQELGVDFLAFSGHKMCAPTGIGVLWGRKQVLDAMPPFLGGGSMIRTVTLQATTYADIPARFEAGTPAIGETIALGEAVDFLGGIGMDKIFAHEQHMLAHALDRLAQVEGLRIYGPRTTVSRGAVISFTLGDIHPHDAAAVLDGEGIAVRAGHHCCQPLHALFDIPATTRASFYVYNIPEEIDRLVAGLEKARKLFE